ncbi:hypothetical protein [Manganibacter manganicus]|uniref:DNA cytosine methyltransferase n=1 Tax=Manganibacter manganicus TaxID=1873176 RepID=A0A1V8RP18_9HYPH|nr:hypothetical protein [Pseudaminobacter manganicus]OQM74709.1 hypothetical protein BFN67_03470 [Pseudaminobacter manganicus]
MKPVAIFLYELSGQSAEPFAVAGWDCYCIDIAHPADRSDGNVHFIRADARHWKPTKDMVQRCRFFAAFPPCDHLAVSGSRWFVGKGLHKLSESVELFAIAAEWAEFFEVPHLIENPVSTISTYWRKPDHTFNPSDYSQLAPSEHYTKKTCLWTGGGFIMPAVAPLPGAPQVNVIRDMAGKGKNRANARSVTPVGFMRAAFNANFAQAQRAAA